VHIQCEFARCMLYYVTIGHLVEALKSQVGIVGGRRESWTLTKGLRSGPACCTLQIRSLTRAYKLLTCSKVGLIGQKWSGVRGEGQDVSCCIKCAKVHAVL
jgi:hypothetical protein